MDKITIIEKLIENPTISQSSLSRKCGLSLGKCHYLLNELEKLGYLTVAKNGKSFTYRVTELGKAYFKTELELLQNFKIPISKEVEFVPPKTAIILAAGKKTGFNEPVALVRINNETIIERTIRILEKSGIEKIVVVTGYKSHLFNQSPISLNKKVHFIENENYLFTGSMASLAMTFDIVDEDFILFEDDILLEERVIEEMIRYPKRDCLLISKEGGSGEETYVEFRNGSLFRIAKEVQQFNSVDGELIGITKISREIFKELYYAYQKNHNPFQGYEYALMDVARFMQISYFRPSDFIWGEIDTVAQKNYVLKRILPKILEKEKQYLEERAKQIFSSVMDCSLEDISEVSRLGGMTNQNFLVKYKGESFIFRIPGIGTEKMIDRKNEGVNAKFAYEAGVDVEMIFFNPIDGMKITRMIENPLTLNPKLAKKRENIRAVARLHRTLHESGKVLNNRFNVFDEMEKYERLAYEINATFYDGYEEVKKDVLLLKQEYTKMDITLAPCHNDPVPENFIKSGDRMYLIDWEYSGMNDPMWDLAGFSLECSFTSIEEEYQISEYFQSRNVDIAYKKRILVNQIFQDFLWSIWTILREAEGTDFGDYGISRFTRGRENIQKYFDLYLKKA